MNKLKLLSLSVGLALAGVANAALSPAQQALQEAQAITAQMTLDQEIGQMTLVKFFMLQRNNQPDTQIDWQRIAQYHLGAILVAGGEVPNGQGGVDAGLNLPSDYLASTQENWLQYTNKVKQNLPKMTYNGQQLALPLLLGIDAVHGDQTVLGNTTFPQNIGLSMTHDLKLLRAGEAWTAHDIKASGFNWAYAPTVAVSHNPDWGRYFETLGSQYRTWVKAYARAMVNGLQQVNPQTGEITGVLATAKHFLGDGATCDGVDEGNDHVDDMQRFLNINTAGYIGALNQADAGSIMVSYSAINNNPMTLGQNHLVTQLRDGSLLGQPYDGLVVSDYGAVDKANSQGLPATPTQYDDYAASLAKAINSGVDLIMTTSTSGDYQTIAQFQQILKAQVDSGAISRARIDDAVAHILAAKIRMGLLMKNSQGQWVANQPVQPVVKRKRNPAEIRAAVQAAEESLVLLKNQHQVLPLNPNHIKYVVFVGETTVGAKNDANPPVRTNTLFQDYNNIGAQNGGWTVAWQGVEGNDLWKGVNKRTSGATSILDGVHQLLPQATLLYPHYASNTDQASIAKTRETFLQNLATQYPDMNAKNTVIIGTLAEVPTAEFMGDVNNPYCKETGPQHDGCLYNRFGGTLNAYVPDENPDTLAINYSSFDQQVIDTVRTRLGDSTPLVSVLLSGRPRLIQAPMGESNAFVAAWLPGTAGGTAIANALFGQYHFGQKGLQNTLSVDWPSDMASLKNYPVYTQGKGMVRFAHPLFKVGYGLKD